MQLLNRTGLILLWLAAPLVAFAAANKNDPYLLVLRGVGNIAIVVTSIVIVIVLLHRGRWRSIPGKLLVMLWCVPPLLMSAAHLKFELRKHDVLAASAAEARQLGPHFMVGYSSFAEVARLAEQGLIGGVYVTRHNIRSRSVEALRAEIAALQGKRRAAGLPPLVVAADQEGGIVGHLAPPLTKLPALATLAGLAPDDQQAKAAEFGRIHGRELAGLGVNLNLAPVLDLKPPGRRNRLDFHTLIGQRAIATDPAVVGAIARAYVRGLEQSGVGATLKHFPGIGRVRTDTHHFSANLDTPVKELEATDWLPFREVLSHSRSALMVGHVTLTAVDPDRAASHSKRVVEGIIRDKWGYQGVVMTDDLVMGAIYQHDVCQAVVEAINAGVDLLLVAYDGAQFYRIFACALDGSQQGKLETAMLRASEARLARGFPSEQARAASRTVSVARQN
ncbi:glycoside hydrolase family 3 N-terminal domain-containing protein [Bradyrhizobium sp. WSM471]|uniref:glycoside hydrolase family 3 N-terminal domain-containing protein n=1 Tax=Bradyrhizobium sp. WSM471 TaxID=319017 RepID=UPI00024D33DF|nr:MULTISPECIES: glycoside hydrolase family 3 N-terminal domain-containing protein [Bradyrhizobium]EHR05987.1 beta-glucosidase-like glycosyl hydrolase [Bradyrhizobium sp. WSM471]UFW41068.1 glycoside hydrolase family 3 protein [Bradyrhizobium canariense]